MLRSNAFGCGSGHVVEHSSTEKCNVFKRSPSLPTSSPNPHTKDKCFEGIQKAGTSCSSHGPEWMKKPDVGISIEQYI